MAPAVKLVIILKQHCPDFVTRFGLGTTINRLGLGTKITRLGLGITMIWLRTLFTHRCYSHNTCKRQTCNGLSRTRTQCTSTHTLLSYSDPTALVLVSMSVEIRVSFIVPLQCRGDAGLSRLQRQGEERGVRDGNVRGMKQQGVTEREGGKKQKSSGKR